MTTPNAAAVFKNESQPDWGLGLVVEDLPEHWVLVFEHAGRKKFIKSMAKALVPVSLDPSALEKLETKLRGRHAARAGAGKAKKSARAVATFASFEEQLRLFLSLFAGGFEDEQFLSEERSYKASAITLAREELSPARFESAPPADLFQSAKRVLGKTNLVYPIEGAVPFGTLAEADRPAALAGLKQLLHGDGDYPSRLERFAASINLKDKAGKPKRVSWPMATLFGALFFPAEQVCVKPTAFASQGATLGLQVDKSQPVTAAGYLRFLEVATEVQRRLLGAGQKPKDLLDVYTFIWRTHAERPG